MARLVHGVCMCIHSLDISLSMHMPIIAGPSEIVAPGLLAWIGEDIWCGKLDVFFLDV